MGCKYCGSTMGLGQVTCGASACTALAASEGLTGALSGLRGVFESTLAAAAAPKPPFRERLKNQQEKLAQLISASEKDLAVIAMLLALLDEKPEIEDVLRQVVNQTTGQSL